MSVGGDIERWFFATVGPTRCKLQTPVWPHYGLVCKYRNILFSVRSENIIITRPPNVAHRAHNNRWACPGVFGEWTPYYEPNSFLGRSLFLQRTLAFTRLHDRTIFQICNANVTRLTRVKNCDLSFGLRLVYAAKLTSCLGRAVRPQSIHIHIHTHFAFAFAVQVLKCN